MKSRAKLLRELPQDPAQAGPFCSCCGGNGGPTGTPCPDCGGVGEVLHPSPASSALNPPEAIAELSRLPAFRPGAPASPPPAPRETEPAVPVFEILRLAEEWERSCNNALRWCAHRLRALAAKTTGAKHGE